MVIAGSWDLPSVSRLLWSHITEKTPSVHHLGVLKTWSALGLVCKQLSIWHYCLCARACVRIHTPSKIGYLRTDAAQREKLLSRDSVFTCDCMWESRYVHVCLRFMCIFHDTMHYSAWERMYFSGIPHLEIQWTTVNVFVSKNVTVDHSLCSYFFFPSALSLLSPERQADGKDHLLRMKGNWETAPPTRHKSDRISLLFRIRVWEHLWALPASWLMQRYWRSAWRWNE